jgi:hypothetical protein
VGGGRHPDLGVTSNQGEGAIGGPWLLTRRGEPDVAQIETVKVKDGAGVRVINKADFVKGEHELHVEKPAEHAAHGKK